MPGQTLFSSWRTWTVICLHWLHGTPEAMVKVDPQRETGQLTSWAEMLTMLPDSWRWVHWCYISLYSETCDVRPLWRKTVNLLCEVIRKILKFSISMQLVPPMRGHLSFKATTFGHSPRLQRVVLHRMFHCTYMVRSSIFQAVQYFNYIHNIFT